MRTRPKAMEMAGVRSYHLAPRAWKAAVGKKIAANTNPIFLEGTRLVVEVQDAIWKTQLGTLSASILARLEKVAGQGLVRELEFRVAPPRKAPAEAVEPRHACQTGDEAGAIEDPIFRKIYMTARRKQTA